MDKTLKRQKNLFDQGLIDEIWELVMLVRLPVEIFLTFKGRGLWFGND